jgi:hypothetical protein
MLVVVGVVGVEVVYIVDGYVDVMAVDDGGDGMMHGMRMPSTSGIVFVMMMGMVIVVNVTGVMDVAAMALLGVRPHAWRTASPSRQQQRQRTCRPG